MSTRGGGASGARASERQGRAGGPADAEAGSGKGRGRTAERPRGGGGGRGGARREAAAVSLRVSAAGLSLAVGGDRGRGKGNGGWPQLPLGGRFIEPPPRWASEERMSKAIKYPIRRGQAPRSPFRGELRPCGPRRRFLGSGRAGLTAGGPGAGGGEVRGCL